MADYYPYILFSPSSSPVSAGYYIAVSGGKYDFSVPFGGSGSYTIAHKLNGESFQIAVFNTDNEYIYPKNVTILNTNELEISFDTNKLPIEGYAIIKKTSNVGYGTTYSFSYAQLGYGSSGKLYNPEETNSLESPYSQIYTISPEDIDQDERYYYITINIDEDTDYSYDVENEVYGIREIGIFDDDGDILFYSFCSLIEKPIGVALKLYYKVSKPY